METLVENLETIRKRQAIKAIYLDPWPDSIIDSTGDFFISGAVGGSAFHIIKGIYNSPAGHRLIGAAQAVRLNAPRVGGRFAAWGGLFSAFDCALNYARPKDDPWNLVAAGAATGGLLHARQGLRAASRYALVGSGAVALLIGAGIVLDKAASDLEKKRLL